MQQDKSLLDRLRILSGKNPDLTDLLEEKFPEIVDKSPFVYSGQLFLKRTQQQNIYVLQYQSYEFQIVNVRSCKPWSKTCHASNHHDATSCGQKAYLTKADFKDLIKKSNVTLDNFKIIHDSMIEEMYYKEFR